jgi:Domain of unknown function (DUF4268)
MNEHGAAYKAFWEALLPQSNRRTGFSIRHAAKRHFVSFQLVGFQFTYMLDWVEPDAMITFLILRSDGEEIFDHLVARRAQVEEACGGSLHWMRAYPVPDDRYPAPALLTRVSCPGLSQLPREQWSAVQAQMVDAMVRLEHAVASQVEAWLPE